MVILFDYISSSAISLRQKVKFAKFNNADFLLSLSHSLFLYFVKQGPSF